MATHGLIFNTFNPSMPSFRIHEILDRAQNITLDNSAKMFQFSRFSKSVQIDVQHVITGYIAAHDVTETENTGYSVNAYTLSIVSKIDPDFLLGYSPNVHSHGAASLTDSSLRKMIRTFFEDNKLPPPPPAVNGQILTRIWTTDTNDIKQQEALDYLATTYYDSFHRAYHSRFPIDTLRRITARNSVSFARPTFLHVPLSFTEPETRESRSTVLPSDYLTDIFHYRSSLQDKKFLSDRTAHFLSWDVITNRTGAHDNFADLLGFHLHTAEIVRCFSNPANTLDLLEEALHSVRFAIVCLDKFTLHGQIPSADEAW